ncbi:MAG: peptidylprolyl isomerase [Methyloceanibacter sp.]|jgi:peptidyl-prolyl cis-trans isomerase A (cyclophilin A)|uniref:peptidylprolyl isomerase n=1 Tax=Methyloceanibacter sp. TaxID=1965321 RepID=UPI003C392164
MIIRTAVLFAATLLLATTMAFAPASAASLGDPSSLNARAPDSYKAKFETSKGVFVIQVTRSWAPNGADRFYNLVKNGFFDDARFFRVIDGFMVQFGISGNPDVSAAWTNATIPDDPVRESNARGTVTFATAGPNTRTTQVFINFNNNSMLNGQGFAPFGKVVSGMNVVDSLYKGYGEGAPRGNGPNQGLLKSQGNAYLLTQFPKLDYIKKATIQ